MVDCSHGESRLDAELVDEPFFLFVGALRYYKGLEYLIDAAGKSGLRVLIAGVGPDLERLRTRAEATAKGRVRFLGLVDEPTKFALMRRALAVVLPSHLRSEAFGMVLVEAAMSGRPMISCELGTGTSYVNVDGSTGRVVPPGDTNALAAAMLELANNAGLRESMGSAARQRYLAYFNDRAFGHRMLTLYENILNGRSISYNLQF
jgi:rhamnosyl/mannosyltransferase